MFTIETFNSKQDQLKRINEIISHEMFQLFDDSGFQEQCITLPEYGFKSLDKYYIFDFLGGNPDALALEIRHNNLFTEHNLFMFGIEDQLPNYKGNGVYYNNVLIGYEYKGFNWDEEINDYIDVEKFYVLVPNDLPATSLNFVE
jgi:hypothetical protein